MPSLRDIVFSAAGWCSLIAFVVAYAAGYGKTVMDYAAVALQPLPADGRLRYDDQVHAIWSGWWAPAGRSRLTNDADPKVVFVARAARDCSVALNAFPLGATQTVSAVLNGGAPSGRLAIKAEQTIVIEHVGDLVDGANVLTLRLPDAHKTVVWDERTKSLGLRSIALACSD
jgi:hypothetical protein